MLTSSNFSGLLTPRFFNNFFPIPPTSTLVTGMAAPNFKLPDIASGRTLLLSDYTGNVRTELEVWNRPVVLNFTRIFTEHQYCPLCFPHIQALNDAYEQFRNRGAEVFMIASTDDRQSRIVLRDLGLKMPLLSDPSCRVFRKYQLGQALGAPLPAQFIVDQTGIIRFRHLFSFLSPNASIDAMLAGLDALED